MTYKLPIAAMLLAAQTASALSEPGQSHVKTADAQVVLISFDNSNGIAEWRRSRFLAARTGAKFTYFLSCVFLIPKDKRSTYRPPDRHAGRSNIGFAPSREDVAERLSQIALARKEGHEIASHACGHFDGKGWIEAQWRKELRSFRNVLKNAYEANGIPGEPADWRHFAETGIRGFRAPYLSSSPALDAALQAENFAFDASGVSRGPENPKRHGGFAHFGLPQIPEGPQERRVIAMDYNLFVRHSGGFERSDDDGVFEERTYQAFDAALQREMDGDQTPLQLGFHFTMMNGGAYWRALERFAGEACVRTDVVCITYSDYLARTVAASRAGAGG